MQENFHISCSLEENGAYCKEDEGILFNGMIPGYDKLKDVKRCACYTHIRRYFLDAFPKGRETDLFEPAVQGVAYCDKLFRYERRYKEQGLSHEQRKKNRLRDEKPVVEAFIRWLGQQKLSSTSNKFNNALPEIPSGTEAQLPIHNEELEALMPWSEKTLEACR